MHTRRSFVSGRDFVHTIPSSPPRKYEGNAHEIQLRPLAAAPRHTGALPLHDRRRAGRGAVPDRQWYQQAGARPTNTEWIKQDSAPTPAPPPQAGGGFFYRGSWERFYRSHDPRSSWINLGERRRSFILFLFIPVHLW